MNLKKSTIKPSKSQSVLIGNKLKLARLTCGYNQTFIGEKLGVTFQQVQKYEKGENRISASQLFRFAQLVKYPINYFFADLPNLKNKYYEPRKIISSSSKVPEKDIFRLNKFFLKIANSNIRKDIINIAKNCSNLENIMGSTNSSSQQCNLESLTKTPRPTYSEYKSITITKEERLFLIQSIQNNNDLNMHNVENRKVIKSLVKKGFVGKDDKTGLFYVEKNVCLLFEMEGERAFDEITE